MGEAWSCRSTIPRARTFSSCLFHSEIFDPRKAVRVASHKRLENIRVVGVNAIMEREIIGADRDTKQRADGLDGSQVVRLKHKAVRRFVRFSFEADTREEVHPAMPERPLIERWPTDPEEVPRLDFAVEPHTDGSVHDPHGHRWAVHDREEHRPQCIRGGINGPAIPEPTGVVGLPWLEDADITLSGAMRNKATRLAEPGQPRPGGRVRRLSFTSTYSRMKRGFEVVAMRLDIELWSLEPVLGKHHVSLYHPTA